MLDLMSTTFSRMTYERARQLLLGAGLLVLLITAAVMYIRRVETVEVLATLLFVPVFVGVVFWDVKGGLLAGIAAAVAYWALRTPAIDAVGADRFIELIASRSVAYIAFGLIGGWANRQLAGSLTKLELYDQIDDQTGLYNARFFVQDTDLEISRAKRYRTIFSVVEVSFPASGLDALSRRQRAALLRDLGRMLKEAVRTVDRPAHGFDGSSHRFAVVLPETAREGALIFVERLRDRTAAFLTERRFHLNEGDLSYRAVVYPDDEAGLEQMRGEYQEIDRSEHPEGSAG
jgi:GGDEF domain-containing protein